MTKKNHLIEPANQNIIGVLCVNERGEGFLHYVNKYSNEPVLYGDSKKEIDKILSWAQDICFFEKIHLTMY